MKRLDTIINESAEEFDAGYADALKQILQGLEKGVTTSSSSSNGTSSDLPQIPWDVPSMDNNQQQPNQSDDNQSSDKSDSNSSSNNSSDSNSNSSSDSSDSKNSNNGNPSDSSDSKDGSDSNDSISDNSNGSSDSKNSNKSSSPSKVASDAAKRAKDAVDKAERAAKGLSGKEADNAQKAIEKAKEAANKAADAADKAKDAEIAGDIEGAKDAAKEAVKDALDAEASAIESSIKKDGKGDKKIVDPSKSGKQTQSKGAGSNTNLSDEFFEDLSRYADNVCKKYANKLSGTLKEFVDKCKISKDMKPNGMAMDAAKGNSAWNKELELVCKQYVFQKLKHMKQYMSTYTRLRRGERAYTQADLKNGRPIIPGRIEKKDKIGFDMSVYIDVSGSMSNVISKVFTATYSIVDAMVDKFGHNEIVDKSKITTNSYVFDTKMKKIPYGSKCSTGGGTYEFDALLNDVNNKGSKSFLNIIITDGEFGSIRVNNIVDILKEMEGLFVLVVNNESNKKMFDDIAMKAKKNFAVIYADEDFTVE